MATTRPWAVTAMLSPASVRLTYSLRLSLSSRIPAAAAMRNYSYLWPHATSTQLPQQPCPDRPGHQIRRVGLDEMTCARNRGDRQIVLHPVPRAVERGREQRRVSQPVDHQHRTLDF